MSDFGQLLTAVTGSPLALVLSLLVLITFMYLARSTAHGAIRAFFGGIQTALRLGSDSLLNARTRLLQRNKEVLLSLGRESTEKVIDREFQRVNAVVERDLSSYPALHRQLSDQIVKIDEDYRQSTDVPPSPPEWIKAVETIARIPTKGDPFVGKILADIHKTLTNAHRSAMNEYRSASRERHRLLGKMLPFWRRLNRTLDRVDETIKGLQRRSDVIDGQMEKYQQILAGTDSAERMLSTSSMTQFATSTIVLIIALLGAFINFHLIALPMSEMVGATSQVGMMKVSDIAALVIILTEIAMGLFLMESLRITRLFPIIATMDDQMRRRMIWVSFGILFSLACVEASLAYMRDLLAADREALTQQLAGVEVAQIQLRWIPSIGQMVLGFMLPFALTFVAIPLESFIQSSRVVFGAALGVVLWSGAGTLKALGGFFEQVGGVFVHVYDFAIVVPLRVEQAVAKRRYEAVDEGRPAAVEHTSFGVEP
jgi:hypothetical protein